MEVQNPKYDGNYLAQPMELETSKFPDFKFVALRVYLYLNPAGSLKVETSNLETLQKLPAFRFVSFHEPLTCSVHAIKY